MTQQNDPLPFILMSNRFWNNAMHLIAKWLLASRTEQPAWALSLIDLLGITSYFAFSEIYPSSKVMHFSSLKKASTFEFSQMLFFDDESRNISEVSSLGVACVHVTQGLNQSLFDASLQRFQQNHFKK